MRMNDKVRISADDIALRVIAAIFVRMDANLTLQHLRAFSIVMAGRIMAAAVTTTAKAPREAVIFSQRLRSLCSCMYSLHFIFPAFWFHGEPPF